MQITARKQRLPELKYAVMAIGLVLALIVAAVAYTITRDDSPSSPVGRPAPVLQSRYVQQAGEGTIGNMTAAASLKAITAEQAGEGIVGGNLPTSTDNDVTDSSSTFRSIPTTTFMAVVTYGTGFGLTSGDAITDMSYYATENDTQPAIGPQP